MNKLTCFLLGGLGGILPSLITLSLIDAAAFAKLIESETLTIGLIAGYAIRVTVLVIIGGTLALVSDARTPLSVLQIGIAAPALITSMMTASDPRKMVAYLPDFVPAAYAQDQTSGNDKGFLSDFFTGLQPGLGVNPDVTVIDQAYTIRTPNTDVCISIPSGVVKTQADYDALVASVASSGNVVAAGVCP